MQRFCKLLNTLLKSRGKHLTTIKASHQLLVEMALLLIVKTMLCHASFQIKVLAGAWGLEFKL